MPVRDSRMARITVTAGMSGLIVALCGCSITGSWRMVSTDPPEVPFPVEVLTFDPDNNYTATGPKGATPRTTTGQYQLRGSKLEILEAGKMPRVYRARRTGDNTLFLTYEEQGARATATFVRTDE